MRHELKNSQMASNLTAKFEPLEQFPGEEEFRKKLYIEAQLFLKNYHAVPYKNGPGEVHRPICKKHSQYSQELLHENQLQHQLFFEGHLSSLRNAEGVN